MSETSSISSSSSLISEKVPEIQQQLETYLISKFANLLNKRPSLAWKPFGLCFEVSAENLIEVCTTLKSDSSLNFDFLIDVTCVDWLDSKPLRYEVVYNFLSTFKGTRLCLKVPLSEDSAKVPSLRPLWHSANFLEREVFDMFGIDFVAHGDLRRILMYDEFVGHPLRKDYPLRGKQPRIELRVPELRNTSGDMKKEQLVSLPTRRTSN